MFRRLLSRSHLPPLEVPVLFLCSLGLAHATEIYDTRTGEMPSWVRSTRLSATVDPADAQRREAQRIKWLTLSPIGSRDYCASSVLMDGKASGAPEGVALSCFMGSTTAQELRASGWELTEVRRSIHPHSPGYEVEVVNLVALKRQCLGAQDGKLRGPVRGHYGCTPDTRDADLRPGLFWVSELK